MSAVDRVEMSEVEPTVAVCVTVLSTDAALAFKPTRRVAVTGMMPVLATTTDRPYVLGDRAGAVSPPAPAVTNPTNTDLRTTDRRRLLLPTLLARTGRKKGTLR